MITQDTIRFALSVKYNIFFTFITIFRFWTYETFFELDLWLLKKAQNNLASLCAFLFLDAVFQLFVSILCQQTTLWNETTSFAFLFSGDMAYPVSFLISFKKVYLLSLRNSLSIVLFKVLLKKIRLVSCFEKNKSEILPTFQCRPLVSANIWFSRFKLKAWMPIIWNTVHTEVTKCVYWTLVNMLLFFPFFHGVTFRWWYFSQDRIQEPCRHVGWKSLPQWLTASSY